MIKLTKIFLFAYRSATIAGIVVVILYTFCALTYSPYDRAIPLILGHVAEIVSWYLIGLFWASIIAMGIRLRPFPLVYDNDQRMILWCIALFCVTWILFWLFCPPIVGM